MCDFVHAYNMDRCHNRAYVVRLREGQWRISTKRNVSCISNIKARERAEGQIPYRSRIFELLQVRKTSWVMVIMDLYSSWTQ